MAILNTKESLFFAQQRLERSRTMRGTALLRYEATQAVSSARVSLAVISVMSVLIIIYHLFGGGV